MGSELVKKAEQNNFESIKGKTESELETLFHNGNNLFLRNFPLEWTEETIRDKFGEFGHINSCSIKNHEKHGRNAFVSFIDPRGEDKFLGHVNAAQAKDRLDRTVVGKYTDKLTGLENDLHLEVSFFQTKQQRSKKK